jgi:hypothetical protein
MKHRHGLLLLPALLLLVTGCGAGTATTTQTSMLRGPTPSSGMTVPRLLTASAPPNFSSSVGTAIDTADPSATDPGASETGASDPASDPSAVGSTDGVLPPDSADADAVPSEDLLIPSEFLGPDGTLPDGSLDPGAGVDLGAIAALIGCTDYAEQAPTPPAKSYGDCMLSGEHVQLYSFATADDQQAFTDGLVVQGLPADSLVQGALFIVDPGPIQLEAVKAALTAG